MNETAPQHEEILHIFIKTWKSVDINLSICKLNIFQ